MKALCLQYHLQEADFSGDSRRPSFFAYFKRAKKNNNFKEEARYGFKGHLLIDDTGNITNFTLTEAVWELTMPVFFATRAQSVNEARNTVTMHDKLIHLKCAYKQKQKRAMDSEHVQNNTETNSLNGGGIMTKGIRAYNLYPKLVGSMNTWIEHFDRIQAMNFNWIYINPINYPGFSGSDYAIKNHYHYHPLYVTGKLDFENPEAHVEKGNKLLKKVCKEADKRGMKIMMDLVINHTAFDSPLSKEYPDWYERDLDGQLMHPGALDGEDWIEWKDLAKINNAHSCDRDNLWNYWLEMMLFYMDLGIRGFRCDAAYHVPSELWRFLIPRIKEKYPEALFLGETLGCQPEQVVDIAEAGFDFISNSFKWWNLREQWFLDQNREYSRHAPSISFPENHDTIRCAHEFDGNLHQALLRYELGAYICSSISTTIGFEYGFQRQIHVVHANPSWWEPVRYDISDDIAKINEIKTSYDVLQEDNRIEMLQLNDEFLFGFTKESRNGQEKIMMLANIGSHEACIVRELHVHGIMGSDKVKDISRCHRMEEVPAFLEYNLHPGEVKLLYVKR